MNILYYSTHGVLEFDEVSIFKSQGHNVCSLGTMQKGVQFTSYRPAITMNDIELGFYADYDRRGGQYTAPADSDHFIPEGFADQFDVVIVMHQFHIIQQNWKKFAGRPVIWRTIGQDIENHERYLAYFRERGLKIARYSQAELRAANTIGCDRIIRFAKDPDFYAGWKGSEPRVLSFVNGLAHRYPTEADDYRQISSAIPCMLGGSSNEAFSNWIGFKSFEEQAELYRTCGAYLYGFGFNIPYTLNFIEAWMTGAPMIIYAPTDRLGYFEIDTLVEDGVTGRVCQTVEEVVDAARDILADRQVASALGEAGRAKAVELFASPSIAQQWANFLSEVVAV